MLRQVEGLSTSETADCLGLSQDVVKTRLVRARAAMREHLLERVGATAAKSFVFQRPRCDRVVAAVLARIC
jgi:RNA polymerase sigma-70 factor (ECF subfamily)